MYVCLRVPVRATLQALRNHSKTLRTSTSRPRCHSRITPPASMTCLFNQSQSTAQACRSDSLVKSNRRVSINLQCAPQVIIRIFVTAFALTSNSLHIMFHLYGRCRFIRCLQEFCVFYLVRSRLEAFLGEEVNIAARSDAPGRGRQAQRRGLKKYSS